MKLLLLLLLLTTCLVAGAWGDREYCSVSTFVINRITQCTGYCRAYDSNGKKPLGGSLYTICYPWQRPANCNIAAGCYCCVDRPITKTTTRTTTTK
ncbi:hypothetical protein FHG87_018293 [Trinorchestia longiramus]|nr:hypothetical protein FHG87_018293 [Trinorchestia longiramus]